MTLPPYGNVVCAKRATVDNHHTHYVSKVYDYEEHLLRRCTNCGFTWKEACVS